MTSPAEKWLNEVENLPPNAYTAAEVAAAFDALIEKLSDMGIIDGETNFWDEQIYKKYDLEIHPGVKERAEQVSYTGGYDDDPYVKVVLKVGNSHFMKTGYYSSFDGTEWDSGLRAVVGKTKTIIEWE